MSFLKKLSSLFGASAQGGGDRFHTFAVQCNRCGEVIQAQIDLSNELSIDYGEDGSVKAYFCRKVLIGKQRCFQQIEVTLTFDANRQLIDRQIVGGKFTA